MAVIRTVLKLGVLLFLAAAVFVAGWLIGRTGIGSVVEPASMPEVERAFVERMRGVTMVGSYTVAGREGRTPRADRYEIASVEKIGEDLWQFNAKMDCCGLDGRSMPIAVPMRFVGDTPGIMMTDIALPGIGTFTVRVFFYGDRYAGTWQHGETGGLMYGRIEKTASP